jgi:hypothetical protein
MLLVGVNVQDSITTFPLQTFRLSLPLYAQLYIQMRDCLGLIDSRQYLGLFIISPRALRPAVECLRIPTFLYPFPILDLISWVFPLRWNIAFSDRNLQLQNFFTMCSKITAQPFILLHDGEPRSTRMGWGDANKGLLSLARDLVNTHRLYGSPITHSDSALIFIVGTSIFVPVLAHPSTRNKSRIDPFNFRLISKPIHFLRSLSRSSSDISRSIHITISNTPNDVSHFCYCFGFRIYPTSLRTPSLDIVILFA